MRRRALILSLVILACLGSCAPSARDGELKELALMRSAEVAGLCGQALNAIEQQDTAKARKILELYLGNAVREADALVADGVRGSMAMPNLRESVRRAGAYATAHAPELAAAANRVANALDKPTDK